MFYAELKQRGTSMRFKTLTASFFYLTCAVYGLSAASDSPSKPLLETALPTDAAAIDKEIQLLEDQLKNYRSDALKKEMDAQPYMFDSWHRFAEDIGQHETDEQHILSIKKRLTLLYERKAVLESAAHTQ